MRKSPQVERLPLRALLEGLPENRPLNGGSDFRRVLRLGFRTGWGGKAKEEVAERCEATFGAIALEKDIREVVWSVVVGAGRRPAPATMGLRNVAGHECHQGASPLPPRCAGNVLREWEYRACAIGAGSAFPFVPQ